MSRVNGWWALLLFLMLCRLVMMVTVPLTDPSEARYAEVARIMASSHDWITPWLKVGVPFWGKPPLSFWVQAASINLFGVTEFAVRLPALLASMLTMLILYSFVSTLAGVRTAKMTVLVYAGSLLPFVMSGVVLTDPFLVLASTWIMASVYMAAHSRRWYWHYGPFFGVALGLLAKGPLVLVIAGGSVLPWLLFSQQGRATWTLLPWGRGVTLTILITLPWYVAAELKTPGFLHYFLIGEHVLRFIEPGWKGDLYGGAHDHARGAIWLYYLAAAFPWSFWFVASAVATLRSGTNLKQTIASWLEQPMVPYLLGWSLFTPAFFTLSGNILWTYGLPALPAFSAMAGMIWVARQERVHGGSFAEFALASAVPIVMLGLVVHIVQSPNVIKSEKTLAAFLLMQGAEHALFLDEPTSSMRFYSDGNVASLPIDQFDGVEAPFVAIRTRQLDQAGEWLIQHYDRVFQSKEVSLFQRKDAGQLAQKSLSPVVGEG